MKIALLVPKTVWSMNFVAQGFKKYVNRPDYTFNIIPLRGVHPKLKQYDFIIGFFLTHQRNYSNPLFKELRNKFIGVLTGLYCYNRIRDWSVFKHVFAVSNAVVRPNKLNTDYSVMPFGIDTELFKPMLMKKKWFTAFMGNAYGRPKQKRVFSWFVPICKEADVKYHIQEGIHLRYFENGVRVRRVPYSKMPELYNQTSVYLMTSSWDGAPLPLLEAASCGLPLLSTDTGYASHGLVQHGVNGYICNSKTDFVEKINYLKNNPQLIEEMGLKSREIVLKNWDWRIRAEEWMSKIEAIMSGEEVAPNHISR